MADAPTIAGQSRFIATAPYAPSWFDHFKEWVERLPTPYWVFYLGLGIVFFLVTIAVEWSSAPELVGKISPLGTWLAFGLGYILALMHFLDRVSAHALDTIRPTMNVTSQEFDSLRFQLTHLPAGSTLVSGLGLAALSIPLFYGTLAAAPSDMLARQNLSAHPLSIIYFYFVFAVTWFLYSTLFVHTIHQLRLVSRIYAQRVQINVFAQGPLYAFSGITSRTAIGLMSIVFFWSISSPESSNIFGGLATGGVFLLLAAATFLLPLRGIHSRLASEKEALLTKNNHHIQTTANELYRQLESGEFQRIGELKDSLTALDIQSKTLDKIPTWPWAPETIRILITALLLPLILFVVQFVVGKFLVP